MKNTRDQGDMRLNCQSRLLVPRKACRLGRPEPLAVELKLVLKLQLRLE
jgi:hypothetical protein